MNVPSTYPTIKSAIDAAVDGDEIVLADGNYTGNSNRNACPPKTSPVLMGGTRIKQIAVRAVRADRY